MSRRAFLPTMLALAIALGVGAASRAHADELGDYDQALSAYQKQDYRQAAKLFEALVGGDPPRATNRVVRLESRKYLGASYLFLQRPAVAKRQFEKLVTEDLNYFVDPMEFPADVVATFNAVKKEALEREAARLEAEKAARENQISKEKQRVAQLEALASTETVERKNSRWLAMLPFGVGQFQNGHRAGGIAFAVTESLLTVGAIATFVGHNSLRGKTPANSEIEKAQRQERALRIGNWATVGTLGLTYLAGVLDAQLRFKPSVRSTRTRPLPDELRNAPALEVGLTPFGAHLRVEF
ncbi:MAG: hypothetical protein R3A47_00480 [Polyangiales bacterium]